VGLVHERSMQAKHMRTRERLDDEARYNAKYVRIRSGCACDDVESVYAVCTEQ
jgi:hypothetical protein